MTVRIAELAATATYVESLGVIEAAIVTAKVKADKEELASEANYLFMVAYRTFDPTKGPFGAWLTKKVRFGLRDRKKCLLVFTKPPERPDTRSTFDVNEFAASLTKDAAKVVLAVLTKWEGLAPRQRRQRLVKQLRKNWTRDRIAEVFSEIRSALES